MKYINHVLPYWPYVVALVALAYLASKQAVREHLKFQAVNARRHKVLYCMLGSMLAVCVFMFARNYELRSPIVSKQVAHAELAILTAETPQDIWNDRALCLQERDELKAKLAE